MTSLSTAEAKKVVSRYFKEPVCVRACVCVYVVLLQLKILHILIALLAPLHGHVDIIDLEYLLEKYQSSVDVAVLSPLIVNWRKGNETNSKQCNKQQT